MTYRAVSLLKPQNLYKFTPLNTIYFSGNILPKAFIHSASNNSLKLTQIAYTTCNNVVIPCFL